MKFFAISDLHLPAQQKPMDIFGTQWENHFERIREDWLAQVGAEDVVLLPGDLTWAMRLEEALDDLSKIEELPGTKILARGNHDYWWGSIGRVRRSLRGNTYALQNDSMMIGGVLIAGSRGWTVPPKEGGNADDIRIYRRERMRLEMSLKSARMLSADAPLIVMLHYPPCPEGMGEGFSDILEKYGVQDCVYGHLHGSAIAGAVRGLRGTVRYHLVSCDSLRFRMYTVR